MVSAPKTGRWSFRGNFNRFTVYFGLWLIGLLVIGSNRPFSGTQILWGDFPSLVSLIWHPYLLPLCLLSLDSGSTSTVCIWSRLSKLWTPAHCGFFDIFDFLPLTKMIISAILGGYYGFVGSLLVNFTMMSHKNTISILRSKIFP